MLHTTGGYLLWVTMTFDLIFDFREGDRFWCTADVGWVTGHSYVVYGPLANGATTVMFDGVPNYPDHGRFWETASRLGVSIFYTAPTAIRALMREGESFVKAHDRSQIRLLGTVGEPINPEAWLWYHRVVGEGRCPIVDTWWQTETGGAHDHAAPRRDPDLKPGTATQTVALVSMPATWWTTDGQRARLRNQGGKLVIRKPAGPARCSDGIWGDQGPLQANLLERPTKACISPATAARRDKPTAISGSSVASMTCINVARATGIGTAEVESALVSHPSKVAEAAVVGMPHEIKGQGIYAYVTLNAGEPDSEELRQELRAWVRKEIGPIATPDALQFAPGLPKTRSGKIMRRILRKIAENDVSNLGDISTLADPSVVDNLVANRVT